MKCEKHKSGEKEEWCVKVQDCRMSDDGTHEHKGKKIQRKKKADDWGMLEAIVWSM